MNCFLHGNSSAVAVCKTCGKGVCSVCAIDKGVAVTCSDPCANEAAVLHEMNQRGKKIYGLTGAKSSLPSGVIVWTLFCLFFIGFAVLRYFKNHEIEPFLIGFGLLCGVIAVIAYRRVRSIGLQC